MLPSQYELGINELLSDEAARSIVLCRAYVLAFANVSVVVFGLVTFVSLLACLPCSCNVTNVLCTVSTVEEYYKSVNVGFANSGQSTAHAGVRHFVLLVYSV